MWLLTGTAILLSFGRYLIRFAYFHALGISDGFHLAALLLLVAFSITYTTEMPEIHKQAFSNPRDPISRKDEVTSLHYQLALSITFFLGVYCVKFSFLFLYRTIFAIKKGFIRAWWAVFALTFLSFWASFGEVLAQCGGRAKDHFKPGKMTCLLTTSSRLTI